MNEQERESWLKELDSRTVLWERKCVGARNRMEVEGQLLLAEIDLGVAEAALERIESKRQQILDEEEAELAAKYPVPVGVVKKEESEVEGMHVHNISQEEGDAVIVTKVKKPKKKVHKNPGAAFALAVKGDEK